MAKGAKLAERAKAAMAGAARRARADKATWKRRGGAFAGGFILGKYREQIPSIGGLPKPVLLGLVGGAISMYGGSALSDIGEGVLDGQLGIMGMQIGEGGLSAIQGDSVAPRYTDQGDSIMGDIEDAIAGGDEDIIAGALDALDGDDDE